MTEHSFVQKKEQTKEQGDQLVVPQLSPTALAARVEAAFNNAVREITRQYFSQAPPRAELDELNRRISLDQEHARDGVADVGRVMSQLAADHPEYVLARYWEISGGNTDWILDERRGTISFNARALSQHVTRVLSTRGADGSGSARDEVVRVVSSLYDQTRPLSATAGLRNFDLTVDSVASPSVSLCSLLAEQLAAQFRLDPPVQATPRYSGGDIIFVSTLAAPTQHMDLSDSKSKLNLEVRSRTPRRREQ